MNDLLNDPTDERLDDRLRTLMRTAVAEPPAPPSLADLDTLVSVGPEPRPQWFRPLTAVAAAVAVLAVGALVLWPSAEDDVDPADSTVPEVVAGQFLDAYYLPSELPAGWQIVEMSRFAAGDISYIGSSVVFERRDGSERGLVSLTALGEEVPASTEAAVDVETGDTTPPLPSSAAEARWNPELRWLSWSLGGREVTVVTSSRTEAAARALAVEVTAAGTGVDMSVDVTSGSAWLKVKEYMNDNSPVVSAGSNSISLVTDRGLSVWVTIGRMWGPTAADWLDPVVGSTDLYESDTGGGLTVVSRFVGADTLEVYMSEPDADLLTKIRSLLASLRPVSEQAWLDAMPDLSATIGTLPAAATFELLDHEVTVRFDGVLGGVCVTRTADGVSGCARIGGIDADGRLPGSFPATGFSLTDGSWVAVSSIPLGSEMCSDPQVLQGATAATALNGDQQLVLLLAPSGFTEAFACPLGGTNPDYKLYIANPPAGG